tara:strand:- start:173 stop:328 length:156 start_codon:yes stop_codon:yes gene_type:complete
MQNYYEEKMNFFFLQWQTAVDADKPIAAAHHMQDYLNYKEMNDMQLRKQQP